jgi:hypothetical protein
VAAGWLAGGLAHRPAVAAAGAERRAAFAALHDYVVAQRPRLSGRLAAADVLRLEERLYRACVPAGEPGRWLCLIVSTDPRPPGVTRDHDGVPNASYRVHGGFR